MSADIPHGDMDSGPGHTLVLGPCFLCRDLFQFNPHTVVSILVDPETRYPAHLDRGTKQLIEPAPEVLARSKREQICNACTRGIGMEAVGLAKESNR